MCQVQTVNLVKGETTCERFARTNYKRLHATHRENMSMELSMDHIMRRKMSIMSIDDNTSKGNTVCGNVCGMCCNQKVMD